MKFRQIDHNSMQIEAMKAGSLELEAAINKQNEVQYYFNDMLLQHVKASMAMTLDQDMKSLIRYIILLGESAVGKFANILLAAATGNVSPYALSSTELETTANAVKLKHNIQLTMDLRIVKMQALVRNNTIHFIFSIPILDEANLFHFFRVQAAPVFGNDTVTGNLTMLIPELDATYLGISKTGTSYVILTPDEYGKCTTTPDRCMVTAPAIPMNLNAHCVVSTYTTKTLTCPLVESDAKPLAFIHTTGNHTVYSVPKPTTLFIKCIDYTMSRQHKDESLVIQGMGEITFRSGCMINFPDGTHFKTPAYYPEDRIEDVKLFELLNFHPVPTNVVIRRLPVAPPTIKPLILEEFRIPSWEEVKTEAFHPVRAIPFMVKFSCALIFMAIIGCLIFFYWRRIRSTCGKFPGCSCCSPPEHPDDRYVGMNHFEVFVDRLNAMQNQMKRNINRVTGSSLSINDRARSYPTLSENSEPERDPMYPIKGGPIDYTVHPQPQVTIDGTNRVRFNYVNEHEPPPYKSEPKPILKGANNHQ